MIRGVAVVFGLVVIVALVALGVIIVVRTTEWWHRRRELRRMEALRQDADPRRNPR